MDDRINRIKPDKEVDRDWQETVSTISAVQEGAVPENGEEKNKYLFEKICFFIFLFKNNTCFLRSYSM